MSPPLRLAVTRAEPGASASAAAIKARGAEAVLAPLFEIIPLPFSLEGAGDAQALVFTSANAVRALGAAGSLAKIPVLTVGDATAAAAKAAGFGTVTSASGTVEHVASLAVRALDPGGGPIWRLHGAHVAGDLDAALRSAGFDVKSAATYEARAVASLPRALAARLEPGSAGLDAVLFHSPRGAQAGAALLSEAAHTMTAVCISQAAAEKARAAPWRAALVAEAPNEQALLDAAFALTETRP
jgi:uroporphyrinogen-III synthase